MFPPSHDSVKRQEPMGKAIFPRSIFTTKRNFLLVSACLLFASISFSSLLKAYAIGFISHHAANKLPGHWQNRDLHPNWHANAAYRHLRTKLPRKSIARKTSKTHSPNNDNTNKTSVSVEHLLANLQSKQIIPGVSYKKVSGPIRLNILDIDTTQAPVIIKPIVAPQGTARLQTVKDYISANHALAAINANYFKNTGLPLGTLIIDGDWVAGPLYDRVSLGISKTGFVRIDRVGLGGTLYTSNPNLPKLWINNINAPRRSGCHTIAYSRHWGNSVSLQYDGCLVSIDAQGRVLDTDKRQMTIPYGGIVLSDSIDSPISALEPGDQTNLRWQITPNAWQDTVHAVSGGPMLIKDNNYCINLKAESFHPNWTSNSIKARTACGVTANNHLLLVTAEGNHTLYDLAHILHKLGAVDAMNLDGGGSTTMVIHDSTVNMESKSKERKVAVALGIFLAPNKDKSAYNKPCTYIPRKETFDPIGVNPEQPAIQNSNETEKLAQEVINRALNLEPAITAVKPLENRPVAN